MTDDAADTIAATTMWVVTAGEYSDYRVLATFTDPDAAHQFAAAHNKLGISFFRKADVEEFPLNPAIYTDTWWECAGYAFAPSARPSYQPEDSDPEPDLVADWPPFDTPQQHPTHPTRPDVHISQDYRRDSRYIVVVGYDRQAVARAFSDRRARLTVELEQGTAPDA